MAFDENLTAEEQAQLDAMRATDSALQDPEAPSPAPADPATSEPAADPAAAPQQPRQQMVPHQALHEERERRKEAEARARTLEERTNLLLQRIGQPQPAVAPPQSVAPGETPLPDLNVDPVGHIVGMLQRQQAEITRLREGETQRQQGASQANIIQQIQHHAQASEQEFRISTPDYDRAVQHLVERRSAELAAVGYSPAQRTQMIQQEAFFTAAQAVQTGRNPAAVIYEIARMRGYQNSPPAAPAPQAAAAPAQQAPAPAVDPGERLAAIAAGQQQARTLGAARGSGSAPMTAQRLIEMPDAEFSQILAKATPDQLREMFGT